MKQAILYSATALVIAAVLSWQFRYEVFSSVLFYDRWSRAIVEAKDCSFGGDIVGYVPVGTSCTKLKGIDPK